MLGIETEVVIFFYAALTGMVLFCGYQILLLIRRLVRHHPLAVGVEDIGFWLLVSLSVPLSIPSQIEKNIKNKEILIKTAE